MKRRDFIKSIGLGAAGLMLGGCGNTRGTIKAAPGLPGTVVNAIALAKPAKYRLMPRTGEKISTIGLGSSYLHESKADQIEKIVVHAIDNGINIMDTVMSDFRPVEAIGRALKGRRDKMLTQIHIGVDYPDNVYNRTRNLRQVQQGFTQQLRTLGTDYSDIGLIHYVDEVADYERVMSNGVFDYARKLKKDGTIRYLGFSSHSVDICRRFLETGEIDLFMLSVNAAYDFEPSDQGKLVISQARRQLYQECEKRGVAITVMKPYGGGRLLNTGTSPFGRAMSIHQCTQYALDRPATISCLPGVRNMADLVSILAYYDTSREERDYAYIANAKHQDMESVCIYCNHCQPCPVGIDIGAVNKYLDLVNAGDELAKDHYLKLARHAGACTGCGACEPRCPFRVNVRERMKQAVGIFGK